MGPDVPLEALILEDKSGTGAWGAGHGALGFLPPTSYLSASCPKRRPASHWPQVEGVTLGPALSGICPAIGNPIYAFHADGSVDSFLQIPLLFPLREGWPGE